MTQDEALAALLAIVRDKTRCFELIKSVREAFPGQSMQWCIEKALADLQPQPVQTWGVKGVVIQPSPSEPLKVSTQSLEALLKAKATMPTAPSSEASRRRLFRLLNGDIDQARRLVQRVRVANPDKSEQWAVDKVLYDLERDRL